MDDDDDDYGGRPRNPRNLHLSHSDDDGHGFSADSLGDGRRDADDEDGFELELDPRARAAPLHGGEYAHHDGGAPHDHADDECRHVCRVTAHSAAVAADVAVEDGRDAAYEFQRLQKMHWHDDDRDDTARAQRHRT